MSAEQTFDPPELIIEAGKTEKRYWQDLWRYRELFMFLAWRDIVVRYKQTLIGIAWALVKPVLSMVVLGVVFGYVAGMAGDDGAMYFVGVFAATLPWEFVSTALSQSSDSLVANSRLLTKVYFPRLMIPLGTMGVSVVDFLIGFVVLLGMMAVLGVFPTWRFLALPFFLLLGALSAMSLGLWMASLNVSYRDFRFIIPVLLRLGYFVSPIGFSTEKIYNFLGSERFSSFGENGLQELFILYYINPVAAVIDGFRWALLDPVENPVYWPGVILAYVMTILLLASGIWFFRKTERTFADVV